MQHQREKEEGKELEQAFRNPLNSAHTWVFWDWINGNVSLEGITKDLESMKEVGIGGIVWRELAGSWCSTEGLAAAHSQHWQELMQWA